MQRYFVQGMIDAAQEYARGDSGSPGFGFQVRFDSTIPAGAPTCHFTMWKATDEQRAQWEAYTRVLEHKALAHARAEPDPRRRS